MYRVERIKNEKLLPYLQLDPIYNAHAIFACNCNPESLSLAAVSEQEEILGTLITGRHDKNYLVWGYWLAASSYDVARVLVKEIEEEQDADINYPLWAEPIIREHYKEAELTIDNLYIYLESDIEKLEKSITGAREITRELYESVEVPEKFKKLFGPEDLEPESKFAGVVHSGVLCSIGERIMDSGTAAAISQLHTIEEERGKGFATDITRLLTLDILKEGKLPFYFFSETNTASRRTCEKAGYVLHSRIGCK